jgi:hypothetical protein
VSTALIQVVWGYLRIKIETGMSKQFVKVRGIFAFDSEIENRPDHSLIRKIAPST